MEYVSKLLAEMKTLATLSGCKNLSGSVTSSIANIKANDRPKAFAEQSVLPSGVVDVPMALETSNPLVWSILYRCLITIEPSLAFSNKQNNIEESVHSDFNDVNKSHDYITESANIVTEGCDNSLDEYQKNLTVGQVVFLCKNNNDIEFVDGIANFRRAIIIDIPNETDNYIVIKYISKEGTNELLDISDRGQKLEVHTSQIKYPPSIYNYKYDLDARCAFVLDGLRLGIKVKSIDKFRQTGIKISGFSKKRGSMNKEAGILKGMHLISIDEKSVVSSPFEALKKALGSLVGARLVLALPLSHSKVKIPDKKCVFDDSHSIEILSKELRIDESITHCEDWPREWIASPTRASELSVLINSSSVASIDHNEEIQDQKYSQHLLTKDSVDVITSSDENSIKSDEIPPIPPKSPLLNKKQIHKDEIFDEPKQYKSRYITCQIVNMINNHFQLVSSAGVSYSYTQPSVDTAQNLVYALLSIASSLQKENTENNDVDFHNAYVGARACSRLLLPSIGRHRLTELREQMMIFPNTVHGRLMNAIYSVADHDPSTESFAKEPLLLLQLLNISKISSLAEFKKKSDDVRPPDSILAASGLLLGSVIPIILHKNKNVKIKLSRNESHRSIKNYIEWFCIHFTKCASSICSEVIDVLSSENFSTDIKERKVDTNYRKYTAIEMLLKDSIVGTSMPYIIAELSLLLTSNSNHVLPTRSIVDILPIMVRFATLSYQVCVCFPDILASESQFCNRRKKERLSHIKHSSDCFSVNSLKRDQNAKDNCIHSKEPLNIHWFLSLHKTVIGIISNMSEILIRGSKISSVESNLVGWLHSPIFNCINRRQDNLGLEMDLESKTGGGNSQSNGPNPHNTEYISEDQKNDLTWKKSWSGINVANDLDSSGSGKNVHVQAAEVQNEIQQTQQINSPVFSVYQKITSEVIDTAIKWLECKKPLSKLQRRNQCLIPELDRKLFNIAIRRSGVSLSIEVMDIFRGKESNVDSEFFIRSKDPSEKMMIVWNNIKQMRKLMKQKNAEFKNSRSPEIELFNEQVELLRLLEEEKKYESERSQSKTHSVSNHREWEDKEAQNRSRKLRIYKLRTVHFCHFDIPKSYEEAKSQAEERLDFALKLMPLYDKKFYKKDELDKVLESAIKYALEGFRAPPKVLSKMMRKRNARARSRAFGLNAISELFYQCTRNSFLSCDTDDSKTTMVSDFNEILPRIRSALVSHFTKAENNKNASVYLRSFTNYTHYLADITGASTSTQHEVQNTFYSLHKMIFSWLPQLIHSLRHSPNNCDDLGHAKLCENIFGAFAFDWNKNDIDILLLMPMKFDKIEKSTKTTESSLLSCLLSYLDVSTLAKTHVKAQDETCISSVPGRAEGSNCSGNTELDDELDILFGVDEDDNDEGMSYRTEKEFSSKPNFNNLQESKHLKDALPIIKRAAWGAFKLLGMISMGCTRSSTFDQNTYIRRPKMIAPLYTTILKKLRSDISLATTTLREMSISINPKIKSFHEGRSLENILFSRLMLLVEFNLQMYADNETIDHFSILQNIGLDTLLSVLEWSSPRCKRLTLLFLRRELPSSKTPFREENPHVKSDFKVTKEGSKFKANAMVKDMIRLIGKSVCIDTIYHDGKPSPLSNIPDSRVWESRGFGSGVTQQAISSDTVLLLQTLLKVKSNIDVGNGISVSWSSIVADEISLQLSNIHEMYEDLAIEYKDTDELSYQISSHIAAVGAICVIGGIAPYCFRGCRVLPLPVAQENTDTMRLLGISNREDAANMGTYLFHNVRGDIVHVYYPENSFQMNVNDDVFSEIDEVGSINRIFGIGIDATIIKMPIHTLVPVTTSSFPTELANLLRPGSKLASHLLGKRNTRKTNSFGLASNDTSTKPLLLRLFITVLQNMQQDKTDTSPTINSKDNFPGNPTHTEQTDPLLLSANLKQWQSSFHVCVIRLLSRICSHTILAEQILSCCTYDKPLINIIPNYAGDTQKKYQKKDSIKMPQFLHLLSSLSTSATNLPSLISLRWLEARAVILEQRIIESKDYNFFVEDSRQSSGSDPQQGDSGNTKQIKRMESANTLMHLVGGTYNLQTCQRSLAMNGDDINRAAEWLLTHAGAYVMGGGMYGDSNDDDISTTGDVSNCTANRMNQSQISFGGRNETREATARQLALTAGLPPKLCSLALEISHDEADRAMGWLLDYGQQYLPGISDGKYSGKFVGDNFNRSLSEDEGNAAMCEDVFDDEYDATTMAESSSERHDEDGGSGRMDKNSENGISSCLASENEMFQEYFGGSRGAATGLLERLTGDTAAVARFLRPGTLITVTSKVGPIASVAGITGVVCSLQTNDVNENNISEDEAGNEESSEDIVVSSQSVVLKIFDADIGLHYTQCVPIGQCRRHMLIFGTRLGGRGGKNQSNYAEMLNLLKLHQDTNSNLVIQYARRAMIGLMSAWSARKPFTMFLDTIGGCERLLILSKLMIATESSSRYGDYPGYSKKIAAKKEASRDKGNHDSFISEDSSSSFVRVLKSKLRQALQLSNNDAESIFVRDCAWHVMESTSLITGIAITSRTVESLHPYFPICDYFAFMYRFWSVPRYTNTDNSRCSSNRFGGMDWGFRFDVSPMRGLQWLREEQVLNSPSLEWACWMLGVLLEEENKLARQKHQVHFFNHQKQQKNLIQRNTNDNTRNTQLDSLIAVVEISYTLLHGSRLSDTMASRIWLHANGYKDKNTSRLKSKSAKYDCEQRVLAMSHWKYQMDVSLICWCNNQEIEKGGSLLIMDCDQVTLTKKCKLKYHAISNVPLSDLRYRFALLQFWNKKFADCIELVDLQASSSSWSVGCLLSETLSHCVFREVKTKLLRSAIEASQWVNPSTDRLVQLDNELVRHTLEGGEKLRDPQFSRGLFAQAFSRLHHVSCRRLRAKLDSRNRLFSVKFKGEEGLDWGGLYRDTLSRIVLELFSGDSRSINLMMLCPNGRNGEGTNNDKFLPDPRHTSKISIEMFEFLGKLIGISLRTSAALPFEFAPLVWEQLANPNSNSSQETGLASVHVVEARQDSHINFVNSSMELNEIEKAFHEKFPDLNFTIDNDLDVHTWISELVPGGRDVAVTWVNRLEYVNRARKHVAAIRRGIVTLVPDRALRLLNWNELEVCVCGNPNIDIEIIKKHTTYHGYSASDSPCRRFWRVLKSFSQDDKSKFLQFVWGRSRLPRESVWPRPFKLTKGNSDTSRLPLAHTCFFQIELPPYSSDEVMRQRLLTAIHYSGGEFLIR
eukprot:GSMAST32.ASY1.ANO1.2772.1 assembled CDS